MITLIVDNGGGLRARYQGLDYEVEAIDSIGDPQEWGSWFESFFESFKDAKAYPIEDHPEDEIVAHLFESGSVRVARKDSPSAQTRTVLAALALH